MRHLSRRHMLKSGGGAGLAVAFSGPSPLRADSLIHHRVPAEEAPHDATFMQWPVTQQVYFDRDFREYVQNAIIRLANTIAAFEPVIVLADANHHGQLSRRLSQNVTLWDIPTDDLWARDSGPLFTRYSNGGLAVSHIQFNGWGRYNLRHDECIAERVADRLGLPLLPADLIGEPGGVETDGHGVLMAHESSWRTQARNPRLPLEVIEQRLLTAYGANRLIWSAGVAGRDVTDFHIDGLARFTGPGRVLMTLPSHPDPHDPFHMAALETEAALRRARLSVDVIYEPERPRISDPEFVAAYANFYVCNGAVIVAEFGDHDADTTARAALTRHYPGREVIQMNADALGELGGGIHCATQQMPAV